MFDCEYPEFYQERRCKARTPHKCCETGHTIQPGEYYWRCTGKWDGCVGAYCQSEAAYHFARKLNAAISAPPEYCTVPFGGVAEEIETCRDEGTWPELVAEWDWITKQRNVAQGPQETRETT